MNSKEENSQDFCPDFVQDSGLWVAGTIFSGNPCRVLHKICYMKGTQRQNFEVLNGQ